MLVNALRDFAVSNGFSKPKLSNDGYTGQRHWTQNVRFKNRFVADNRTRARRES